MGIENDELSKLLIPTIPIFIVGLITLYIAYQQYIINRYKLRLDLYNKRYKIYLKLKEFLYHIKTEKRTVELDLDNMIKIMDRNSIGLIFDVDINSYLNDIYSNIEELQSILKNVLLSNDYEKNIILPCEKEEQLFKWFEDHYKFIDEKFSKYLSFKNIK